MSSGVKSTNRNKHDLSIVAKNLKLAWASDFHSVKSMVVEYLVLDGTWTSPGGEKKVFYVADSPVVEQEEIYPIGRRQWVDFKTKTVMCEYDKL